MMNKCIAYAGVFLLLFLSGCANDDFISDQTDVFVTVRGESAFGTWQRDFVGPEADAEEFASEAVSVVHAVAEKFKGSVRVQVSIGDTPFETVETSGDDQQVVPAAILALQDIAALGNGFLPQGSLDELRVPASVAGQKPCICKGTGCCCSGSDCDNVGLSCEGCSRWESYCIGGAMCWFAPGEED